MRYRVKHTPERVRRIGSLFAGVGGLELGLELAGCGETIWQVEKSEYCKADLAKNWPYALRFDDVRDVGRANLPAVDIICGGFPCTDISSAGKRAGLAGAQSGLWFEYLRIVSELQPAAVVVENVTSGANRWVDAVSAGLGVQGYACFPIPIEAAHVGAPHKRARIFIVAAHVDARAKLSQPIDDQVAASHGSARSRADAQRGELWHESGRRSWTRGQGARVTRDDGQEGHVARDAHVARFEGTGTDAYKGRARLTERTWRTPIPELLRVADGLSRGLDRPRNRIQALGNAVVPQCAEVVGHFLAELLKL